MSGLPPTIASGLCGHVDGLAILQAHIRFAPAVTATGTEPERFDLAFDVHQVDRFDLDVEQRLDRRLDLLLVRILRNLENVLVVLGQARTLFRHMRRAQHAVQVFVLDLAHASHSSIFFTDSTVTSTLSASTRLTGSIAATSTTATCGRLRADRYRFWSTFSVTISVR